MAAANGEPAEGQHQQNGRAKKKAKNTHQGSGGLVWLALAATVAVVAVAVTVSRPEYVTAAAAKSSEFCNQLLRQWGVMPVEEVSGTGDSSPPVESAAISRKPSASSASVTSPPDSGCTCQVKRLSGVVDDCCCEYETVDDLNSHVLQPLLTQLVNTTFFKYFKVRLWCDCPFWLDDGMCHSRDCSVGECKDDEVPAPLRCPSPPAPSLLPADVDEPRDADLDPTADESASAESAAGSVDRTVDRSAFQAWVEADNPWTSDDESDTASQVYVNLALNPERYTGYGGDSARRIWQAIYQESCFQDGTKDECTERRVLYRLISGLHQAISVHVAASQIWDSAAGQWGPNITIFHHRVAKFPERLANLYFTFLFVLRAATKAADFLSRASYDTGNPLEDTQTAALVQQVVRNERLQAACPLPFDEARMWRGDEGPQLKQTLQGHFRNISLIMDCVGCERCRLWGKLEMLGLATALKILFSVDGNGNGNGGNGEEKLSLQRNEVVALFNTLWRFSHALNTTAELVTLLEMNPPPDAPATGAALVASVSGGGAAGAVPLQKTSLSIIDTSEFQRLRHIRQLGVCYYVYPSANHTRLEHSIGTSHLANQVVESLRRQQPELGINDDDVMAVTLAGLCHDMGHGCFSHMLDSKIFSRFCPGSDWHHEKRSADLVERMVDNNNIDIVPDTIATIQSLILPDKSKRHRDYTGKEFLWDIVANARTGIDVDKFDYLARDSYFCNIKSCFDHKRIIHMMRVIDDEICFKYSELETVNELFWLRAKMYRNVYAHKTVKAVEAMILEALTHANHVFRFSDIVESKDLDRFCQLDDTILREILRSRDPSLAKLQEILRQLERRQLYQYMNEFVVPVDALHHFKKLTVDELLRHGTGSYLREHGDQVIVDNIKIDYGQDTDNPLYKVRFFDTQEHRDLNDPAKKLSKFPIPCHRMSTMMPQNYKDMTVRVYIKTRDQRLEDEVKEAFVNYQMKTFGREVMRTPSRKRMRRHHENGGGITNGGGTVTEEFTGDDDDVVCSQTARKLM
ncbi:unnamed protein product [Closterium sp. Yama58-4]|nr:unnamed protein product [Closterium sp. Yama58-4]